MKRVMIFILMLPVTVTGQHSDERGGETMPDTAVAARVGKYIITADNLLESYEVAPAFVKLRPDPLGEHLRYLIYEHLMALEAERLGYDTTETVRRMIEAVEEDLTADRLYVQDVLSGVELSEEHIRAGVQKGRVRIRLRWMFSESQPDAESIYAAYREGASFDSLFSVNLSANQAPESRMYEGTQLNLERDNPELMKRIVFLKSGEVSQPIEGPDGFYIFRIDEIWQNPILPEHEYTLLREQAITVLTKLRADEISAEYIRELFEEKNPEIVPAGMHVIRAYLAEKGLSEERREEFEIPMKLMTEGGPVEIVGNPEFLEMPVARSSDLTIAVRDYLDWFELRQFQIRRHSRSAFETSILQSVTKMIQDRMLIERAYRRGLYQLDEVRSEKARWQAKILYSVFRRELARSVQVTDRQVLSYYNANRRRYADRQGTPVNYEEIRERVRAEVRLAEENRLLHRLLNDVQHAYPVEVDQQIIDRLSGSIDESDTPINVIFYKPGGTFPRVAYPTIDQSWRYFEN